MKNGYSYEVMPDTGWFIPTIWGKPIQAYRRPEAGVVISGGFRTITFKTEEAVRNYIKRAFESQLRRRRYVTLWKNAIKNMPWRRSLRRKENWLLEKSISVPEFIKGRAKKTHIMVDGNVLRRECTSSYYFYGQRVALAYLMDMYVTSRTDRRKRPHGLAVHTSSCCGTEPRSVEKRVLLKQLADDKGKKLALKLLTKRFGEKNRYKY